MEGLSIFTPLLSPFWGRQQVYSLMMLGHLSFCTANLPRVIIIIIVVVVVVIAISCHAVFWNFGVTTDQNTVEALHIPMPADFGTFSASFMLIKMQRLTRLGDHIYHPSPYSDSGRGMYGLRKLNIHILRVLSSRAQHLVGRPDPPRLTRSSVWG